MPLPVPKRKSRESGEPGWAGKSVERGRQVEGNKGKEGKKDKEGEESKEDKECKYGKKSTARHSRTLKSTKGY